MCDLDGVVYLADTPVEGAAGALAEVDRAGIDLLFVTNNSTRPPDEVAGRIEAITGFPARPDKVLTSAQAAARLLRGMADPALVLGGEGIVVALAAEGLSVTDDPAVAGAVVVGLDRELSYERLRRAVTAVRSGARLVATNHDPTYPTPGGLWPGAGAIVAAVERASGAVAEVAGKPHGPMRALVRERAGSGPVWVVGDRVDTDLAMAAAEGWIGVLVLSGVTAAPLEGPGVDHVLGSIAGLPGLLGTSSR